VAELNNFQPTIISTMPTAGSLIAREQDSGRLKVKPILIQTFAETLEPAVRSAMEAAFACPVRDLYGAHECLSMAFDCGRGWLHYNADWMVLEPIDEQRRPVPPGSASRTVLLTNLANLVQPIIRYELGDSITIRPDRCPCGSPLPAIRVVGRSNEVLAFPGRAGWAVSLAPSTLSTCFWETGGVNRSQIIQKAPLQLSVRMEVKPGKEDAEVWEQATRNLRAVFEANDILPVEIVRDPQPPTPDPVSGKLRRVWSECSPINFGPSATV
jgi:phenylacetate-coenzyme A ligase PaaK-like adenylate-forming protein